MTDKTAARRTRTLALRILGYKLDGYFASLESETDTELRQAHIKGLMEGVLLAGLITRSQLEELIDARHRRAFGVGVAEHAGEGCCAKFGLL